MDVYLVPVGDDRDELYCERMERADAGDDEAPATGWRRVTAILHRALAEGERARHAPAPDNDAPHSRVRRWFTRKLAEAVAEQRLLWHLRHETHVRLVHADDLTAQMAIDRSRRSLGADRDKHFRWAIIDAVLALLCAPIALLPGPNVFAYYFIFRSVGHYLSWRGAGQGLTAITWQPESSPHLTALRQALHLTDDVRGQRLDEIAAALGLDRLASFVDGG
jgi:hypothetical protein